MLISIFKDIERLGRQPEIKIIILTLQKLWHASYILLLSDVTYFLRSKWKGEGKLALGKLPRDVGKVASLGQGFRGSFLVRRARPSLERLISRQWQLFLKPAAPSQAGNLLAFGGEQGAVAHKTTKTK